MYLTFLGTGTSHGVPVIACNCAVCKSKDKKNKRYRSSVYIKTDDDKDFIVDTSPEFRLQCINNNITHIDAIFLTHSHADHLHGIDDLRIFSSIQSPKTMQEKNLKETPPIPIYTNKKCSDDLTFRFPYLFRPVKEGGGHANIELHSVSNSFQIGTTKVTPIPMMHGHLETTGWLFTTTIEHITKSVAYLTDCSFISEESFQLIKDNCGALTHLIIDGLRIEPHSTHFCFLQAMEAAEKIGIAKHIWFTHLTHKSSHNQIIKYIDENIKNFPNLMKAESVLPAYDGLTLKI